MLEKQQDSLELMSVTKLVEQGLIGPDAFSKCKNLKTLKLIDIVISQANVLSGVLAAFSSLEVIVLLNVNFLNPRGVLKIENNNLKFLQLYFPNEIDRMEVYAGCLDVLDISFIKVQRDNFILVAPNIQVNKNAWLDDHGRNDCPHLYLSVDITDPKEVEILKEVLLMWTDLVMELEIFFKNKKSHREEGEYSTNDRTHGKLFPNANLCVCNVRLYNFDGSSEEEFAFVSRLVMQKPEIVKIMIETSLFPRTKKFNAEAAVAKLMELPKYYKNLKIECF
ncbi:F-box protein [Raphanus sativus]|nr:F-box protein [Raphanus sativus]